MNERKHDDIYILDIYILLLQITTFSYLSIITYEKENTETCGDFL